MITRSASASHLELEAVDPPEILRLALFLGVDPTRICKVSVLIIREGVDDESCYEKFTKQARAALAELDSQLDFTIP